jgi:acyl-coenzyme A synthetase/AMP-(fatty) acid ligase
LFLERDGRQWYNTGDVVREDPAQGFIYLGRRDRMVKRRGYRIELGEIERGLYQHPQVREAAVVAVSDGEAHVKIAAFVTPRAGERPTIIDLKSFCGRQLLSYMSPDHVRVRRRIADDVDEQGRLSGARAQDQGALARCRTAPSGRRHQPVLRCS